MLITCVILLTWWHTRIFTVRYLLLRELQIYILRWTSLNSANFVWYGWQGLLLFINITTFWILFWKYFLIIRIKLHDLFLFLWLGFHLWWLLYLNRNLMMKNLRFLHLALCDISFRLIKILSCELLGWYLSWSRVSLDHISYFILNIWIWRLLAAWSLFVVWWLLILRVILMISLYWFVIRVI